jgi:hypothetical protein
MGADDTDEIRRIIAGAFAEIDPARWRSRAG